MSAFAYDMSGPFVVITSQGSAGSWLIFSCRALASVQCGGRRHAARDEIPCTTLQLALATGNGVCSTGASCGGDPVNECRKDSLFQLVAREEIRPAFRVFPFPRRSDRSGQRNDNSRRTCRIHDVGRCHVLPARQRLEASAHREVGLVVEQLLIPFGMNGSKSSGRTVSGSR
jgi:hypothetical protein